LEVFQFEDLKMELLVSFSNLQITLIIL